MSEMDETSTIPIILDTTIYSPTTARWRPVNDGGSQRARLITLPATVYEPKPPRRSASANDAIRPVSKVLPPVPLLLSTVPSGRPEIKKSVLPPPPVGIRRNTEPPDTRRARARAPSGSASRSVSSTRTSPNTSRTRRSPSDTSPGKSPPWSHRGRETTPRSSRPTTATATTTTTPTATTATSSPTRQDGPRLSLFPVTRAPPPTYFSPTSARPYAEAEAESPPSVSPSESKQPLSPPSRKGSGLYGGRPPTAATIATAVSDLHPHPHPHHQYYAEKPQTQYMRMLLSLGTIPRLHNILAHLFAWILLLSFAIIPGAFVTNTANTNGSSSSSSSTSPRPSIPLVVVAQVCASVGITGLLWLALRWRNNYVWLLNRVYLPGALHGLAGAAGTLAVVYGQQQQQQQQQQRDDGSGSGGWSVEAIVAIAVEAATMVVCGAGFVVYRYRLLSRVQRRHEMAQGGGGQEKVSFAGRMSRLASEPALAPGSVV